MDFEAVSDAAGVSAEDRPGFSGGGNPDSRIHGYNFGEAGRKRGAERDPRYGKKAFGKALRKGAEAYGCHRLRRERGGQQPAGV